VSTGFSAAIDGTDRAARRGEADAEILDAQQRCRHRFTSSRSATRLKPMLASTMAKPGNAATH